MSKGMKGISDKIVNVLKDKSKAKLFLALGLIGIALIFLADIIKPDQSKKESKANISELNVNTDDFKEQMQNELTSILSRINGVGNVNVMLTIEGSTEYVFAEEYNTKSDKSGDKTTQDYSNKYVIVDKGNSKDALVKKILRPKVSGAIIVCDGGDNPAIKEKVYQAAIAVLNIPSNKICVAKG